MGITQDGVENMNLKTEGLLGCNKCYWMGRVANEDSVCPCCGNINLFDTSLRYNSTNHELETLDNYEIYLLHLKYKEKRNEQKIVKFN